MASVEKQRERLIELLKELFQLDQPDLDFGFYRIMHAKADQVSKFLEVDLLSIIRDAFGEADESRIAESKAAYEAAAQQAKDFGAPDPEATEPVKQAKAAYDAAKDSGSNEGDVYDHLYRFFERYYDNGDFMSRRYFARETDGKAAPYAVPYDGREVYLHWANRDQYYIKTSEHLTNFAFNPVESQEFKSHHGQLFDNKSLLAHCRIVRASEGEHNNVKATEQTERYFIIYGEEPVKIETGESGEPELVIKFEYRVDPDKTGQEGTWRKKRLNEAVSVIKNALPDLPGAEDFVTALLTPAPTEKEKDRTLLDKYLHQYTARNTMDYFIHKDLGGFLRRELDFYIKNEVMRLDDIETADAPRVETYLAKVKVLRTIAQHLIDFLAQLENFQKKLWLKKKFVVETNYCITLDRIPEEFYPEIAANETQREEWVRLFAIDELEGYSEPLTEGFLSANDKLLVDTALYGLEFRDRLLAEKSDIDRDVNGQLIHSENFQALNLLAKKHRRSIDAVYIDPPYNTVHSEIAYKNSYKHSSWLSLIQNGIQVIPKLFSDTFSFGAAIDDYEHVRLSAMLRLSFPELEHSTVIVNHHPQGSGGRLSRTHEYLLLAAPSSAPQYLGQPKEDETEDRSFMRSGSAENNFRHGRWKSFYALLQDPATGAIVDAEPPVPLDEDYQQGPTDQGLARIYPINSRSEERVWRSSFETGKRRAQDGELTATANGTVYQSIDHCGKRETLFSNWTEKRYNAGIHGTNILSNMGLGDEFDYPKSLYTMIDGLWAQTYGNLSAHILDYFGGSGTTGHAIIETRRAHSNADWKFTIVEMGNYFDTVLKPRILKSSYSASWKDAKPIERDGLSQFIKCIRLETYEDALNNLAFQADAPADGSDDFNREFMLNYWLDFETKGSPSLLNIEKFSDPTAYTLRVKKPGTDEYVEKAVDLIETFNWLIGLHVEHLDRWRGYDTTFKREEDPELPEDSNTRLILEGNLKETDDGTWRLRKVEGYTLRTPGDHSDRERALVIWRKLTGDLERDNLVLDEWFKKYRLSTQDSEFDVIYVNGSNNLPNLRQAEETWKVRLIEEAFHQAMWDVED